MTFLLSPSSVRPEWLQIDTDRRCGVSGALYRVDLNRRVSALTFMNSRENSVLLKIAERVAEGTMNFRVARNGVAFPGRDCYQDCVAISSREVRELDYS